MSLNLSSLSGTSLLINDSLHASVNGADVAYYEEKTSSPIENTENPSKRSRTSEEARKRRLEWERLQSRRRREQETPEQRSLRLEKEKIRSRERRAKETPEQREYRLAGQKLRNRRIREKESEEKRAVRLDIAKERSSKWRKMHREERASAITLCDDKTISNEDTEMLNNVKLV